MFAATAAEADFSRDIQPLLADRCFQCHGPDANTRKGGLRLDLEAEAKKSAIVPGDVDASELIRRITTADPDDRMPPAEAEKAPFTEAEIARLKAWISEGAPWAQHWAFVAPVRPEAPAIPDPALARNEIDHFVQARLATEGLAPAPEADRIALIRRVTFDLTGLPPTLDEIDAFINDTSPEAYEKVVDRLLASPHYGERMAADWLDGARYADTNGYQNDFHRVMWPWRDWVIEAFNENMPYDQFAIEQLAGDLLPNATTSQRVATGFNRNNRSVTEAGSIEEEWHLENLVDRVETTSAVFLGLTMGCARCHDHKYDPLSQREFYQFYGFFNSSADKGFYEEQRGNTGPVVQLPTHDNQQKLAKFDADIAEAKAEVTAAETEVETGFEPWQEKYRSAPAAGVLPLPVLDAPLSGHLQVSAASKATLSYPAGAPVWAEGLAGPALSLSGAAESHVDLGQAVTFELQQPYSVVAWVKPDGAGALFSKMDDANGFRGVDTLITEDGRLAVHIIHTWTANALKVVTEPVLQMGVWSHVAITHDGSGKSGGVGVYVDGRKVPAKPEVDSLTESIATDQPLRIGRRLNDGFLKGAVNSFRVYGSALSAEQITALVEAGLAEAMQAPATETRAAALRAVYTKQQAPTLQAKRNRVQQIEQKRSDYEKNEVPSVMVMEELPEPRPTYLFVRGAYHSPDTSDPLQPAVPQFLPPLPEGTPQNRLGLAQWIVNPANPLTARVTVNRIWQRFFGTGLVKTPDNFGVQSDPPSHPKLLDWLATEFIARGWDLKSMQKLVVMSATYRQQSTLNEDLLAKDPENRLLARGPRYRLPAEMIRDTALAVSGLLAPKIGGPPTKPYQPDGLWEELAGGASQGPYTLSEGEDLYRRSLYTHRKRTVPHPTFGTFDAPSFELCQVKRPRTNTPLQALALLNDTTYVEAARHLAQRMIDEAGPQVRERVRHGFRLVTGRYPNEREETILLDGLREYISAFGGAAEEAEQFVAQGKSPVPEDADKARLAAFTALASALLNLDETVTKE
jgi:hypothetical protein